MSEPKQNRKETNKTKDSPPSLLEQMEDSSPREKPTNQEKEAVYTPPEVPETFGSSDTPVQDTSDVKPKKKSKFSDLGLIDELLEGVLDQGYKHPTPIQVKAIPPVIKGRDVVATAKTGSGKTAAFVLPILQDIHKTKPKSTKSSQNKYHPRALILSPVRELASQIAEATRDYGRYVDFNYVTIYGGVSQKGQVNRLRKGADIVIATPGRLLDLIRQGQLTLDYIETFVLDEADRMLDMGFIDDIRKLSRMMPKSTQVLLFSATMPEAIIRFAKEVQNNAIKIEVDGTGSTVETVQSMVMFVKRHNKIKLLKHLLRNDPMDKVLIFVRTKRSVDWLYNQLKREFRIAKIHGGKSQKQRERSLDKFAKGKVKILVGTDVAARGLDVDDITHVINYDISQEPEVYIHRIGRTARAGKEGVAYTFVDDENDRALLEQIEELVGYIPEVADYPYRSDLGRYEMGVPSASHGY